MFAKMHICKYQSIYIVPKKHNVNTSTIQISTKLETTQVSIQEKKEIDGSIFR